MNEQTSLQKLSGIGKPLLQPLSPEDTYTVLIKQARKLIDAEYGSVFLWHKRKLHRVYTSIPESQQIIPRSRGFAYSVYKTGKPFVLPRTTLLQHHPEAKDTAIQSLIIIPLCDDNQSLGVLTLQSSKKVKLSKSEEETLKIFGSLASLSVRKMQLHQESKEAVRMRDLFISLAAHELRTPLTTMNAYIQLLKKKLEAANTPEHVWIQALSSETTLIIKLVNELLNVDLIQHGAFSYHMKPILLRTLVKRALQQFSVAFPFHHILVRNTIPVDARVIGDSDKLLQMLSSLFQNAAKFSSPEKDILFSLKEKDGLYVFSLEDHGIGIHPQDMKKIFNGFYKGRNNYQDGIGLGLFFTKRIIEKHNGKIQITSQKNKGTKVTVSIPKFIP